MIRAISLWQPWASAMAIGAKVNETRSWPTSYRGDLLICSAKRKPSPEEVGDGDLYRQAMAMPYGYALCVVELYECRPTEASLGDYTPGRFTWCTRNLRRLRQPLPMRGRQGLWALTPEEEAQVRGTIYNVTLVRGGR